MSQQVKVLTLKENLNTENSPEFQQQITQMVETGTKIVLVDCQNITFLDSSGLGSLVLAFKTLRNADIKMVLCSVNEQVRMIFELSGTNEIFEIFASQEDFHQVLLAAN
jgi:anti-anti-sigma factor